MRSPPRARCDERRELLPENLLEERVIERTTLKGRRKRRRTVKKPPGSAPDVGGHTVEAFLTFFPPPAAPTPPSSKSLPFKRALGQVTRFPRLQDDVDKTAGDDREAVARDRPDGSDAGGRGDTIPPPQRHTNVFKVRLGKDRMTAAFFFFYLSFK